MWLSKESAHAWVGSCDMFHDPLLQEGLPVLHLIYNCQEPLQGQCLIILSGGPVVYLSQCLEQAVIVMAMGLTEAVDHKKVLSTIQLPLLNGRLYACVI